LIKFAVRETLNSAVRHHILDDELESQ